MRIGVDLVHPTLLRYGVRIIAPPSVSATVPHALTDSAERAQAPRPAITGRSSKIVLCCHMRNHHIRRCSGPGAMSLEEFAQTGHEIPQNWATLGRYLGERGLSLGRSRPRQFAGGYGNLNYLIEIDGRPAVLRRPPPGPLPHGANDMAREYRILSSLWREYPLAPRALLFCDDTSVLGAPFQMIEYRPGLVIRDTLPPELALRPDIGALLSRQLVEALAALHAIEPS